MRALTFLFALMVGLAMAFLAPAMAGGHDQAPAAMVAPEMADAAATDLLASDLLAADLLSSDLLAELSIDPAPGLDVAA
ncbi:hypothetical protein [Synechococcus sp. FACHB-909]|uniref:hypothetical protein n=1 Tax=Synechococcus sp. FACHB-909 TaxID=2692863 RepID=UPI0016897F09|nr:hypothetical protein [Synechococcus sp. FACHB-909]MBD2720277.1 hypothetical protein [Synechococcus sp. FACHB-909]